MPRTHLTNSRSHELKEGERSQRQPERGERDRDEENGSGGAGGRERDMLFSLLTHVEGVPEEDEFS
jgi:hypothetical protein